MVQRREGANPHRDIGVWKHVESVSPYDKWEKRLSGGGRAHVVIEETSRQSEHDYWAHIEYTRGYGWEWSDERLPAGSPRKQVVRETVEWMRRNQNWEP